jgi:hypothetical protein
MLKSEGEGITVGRKTGILKIAIIFALTIAIVHAAENKDNVFITTQSYEAIQTGDTKTEMLWEARVFNNNDHAVSVVIEAQFYCRTDDGNTLMDKDTSALTLAPKEAKTQIESFCTNKLLKKAIDDSTPIDLVIEIKAVEIEFEEDHL